MKVLLVFPRFRYPSGDPPLGVAILAASASKVPGTRVNILDGTFLGRRRLEARLLEERQDLYGFSVMTSTFRDACELARSIKRRHPDARVVFGGPHPTVLPESTLAESSVDAIVTGEGEGPFREIVARGGAFEGIPGVAFKRDGRVVDNGPAPVAADLDALPFPAYDLLDMARYTALWFQMDAVSPDLRGTNVLATRGCPFRCSFCQPTLSRLFGTRLRRRSPDNIVRELRMLKERFGIGGFMFADDTLNVDSAWLKSLCGALLEARLGLSWSCNMRADLFRSEDLQRMKEAGLRKVFIGMESAQQRILDDVYHKDVTVGQVEEAVRIAHSMELKIQGYFMLGAPSETIEEIRRTVRFACALPIDDATFSIATPLPATHLYEMTRQSIELPAEDMDYYRRYAYGKQFGLGQRSLTYEKIRAYGLFYLSGARKANLARTLSSRRGIRNLFAKLKRLG
ncbi:MAG TPA: radical SAM protein [Candidatus Deferrimicrobiaceae bacterium]|jgi:radical SAM superfamily enzyme YgiQ (UPF0313 family)